MTGAWPLRAEELPLLVALGRNWPSCSVMVD